MSDALFKLKEINFTLLGYLNDTAIQFTLKLQPENYIKIFVLNMLSVQMHWKIFIAYHFLCILLV